jgi:general secretion pathway protein E
MDRQMETMVHDGASEQAMETYARSKGPGIVQSGRDKVLAGLTTLREILRVTIEE